MKKCLALLLALVFALSSSGCMGLYLTMELADRMRTPSDGAAGAVEALPTPDPMATPEPALPVPDGNATETPSLLYPREERAFSDMPYVKPDTDAMFAAVEALEALRAAGETDSGTLLARYREILALYSAASTQLSLAYVYYAFDVTEPYYQDEYNALELRLTEFDLALTDLTIALYEDARTAEAMAAAFPEEFREMVYAGELLNSEEIQEDLEKELELVSAYDTLLTTFVLEDGGRTYTMEEIGSLAETDYDEYNRLYDAYFAALNAEAGALYLDLLAVRRRIAETLDFSDYAAYQYACYDRDYSTDEVRALHAAVKEHIAPLYVDLTLQMYLEGTLDVKRSVPMQLGNFLIQLQEALSDFSPEVLEALNFMLRNDLYTTSVSDKKMESSFTTYFDDLRAPYLFTQWEDDGYSASTIIHELGHYANYYMKPNSGWSVGSSLDLAEVDSQGLEMLLMPYYETFYGSYAETLRRNNLLDGLYALLSGCMEDEFQQEVYRNPDMSLAEMNALYARLAEEYGFTEIYVYTGLEWVMIPHTFQSPMYYISYAASVIPALELFALSETDPAAASAAYHAILKRPAYARLRETVQQNGLHDPIAPETIAYLAEAVRSAFDG